MYNGNGGYKQVSPPCRTNANLKEMKRKSNEKSTANRFKELAVISFLFFDIITKTGIVIKNEKSKVIKLILSGVIAG